MYRLLTDINEISSAQLKLDKLISETFELDNCDNQEYIPDFPDAHEITPIGCFTRYRNNEPKFTIRIEHSFGVEMFDFDVNDIGYTSEVLFENSISFYNDAKFRKPIIMPLYIGIPYIETSNFDVNWTAPCFFARHTKTNNLALFTDGQYYKDVPFGKAQSKVFRKYICKNITHTVSSGGIIRSGMRVCRIEKQSIREDLVGIIDSCRMLL